MSCYCEQEGSTLIIELYETSSAVESGLNNVDVDTTYIIVDNNTGSACGSSTAQGDNKLHGAAFFGNSTALEIITVGAGIRTLPPRADKFDASGSLCHQAPATFSDALRVRKKLNANPWDLMPDDAFKILRIQDPYRFKIKHGLLCKALSLLPPNTNNSYRFSPKLSTTKATLNARLCP